ncbi:uncharacterized protein LOC142235359 [Haematobia irritans]|uniref:uncharacterized protein LOC142235359 n=1 Tax=Haematobia irritans TaxID=7368 RepID=UPI003F4F7927
MADEMNVVLKNIRVLKASLTRAHTFANEPIDNLTVEDLNVRISRLDNLWVKFEEWTTRLYDYEEIDGYTCPDQDIATYEEKYLSTKGRFETLKRSLGPRESTPNLNDAFSRFADQQSSILQRVAEVPSQSRGELPKIRIEPFTGNYKDWCAFKDLFSSTIGSRTDLSDVQKFHYLTSLLRDDASRLIRHLQVSDASYSVAWERLEERYDRPRHIVTSYIETFMSLKPAKEEDPVGLRKISDTTHEVIRGLDAIGKNGRDPWLLHLLSGKLDAETRRRWFEHSRDEVDPTVGIFLKFLDQRCEQLELGSKRHKQHGGRQQSMTTMVATGDSRSCFKCSASDHLLHKCPQFLSLSIDQRRSFVRVGNLCFNCLGKGHTANACSSNNRCKTCKRKHHSLTHQEEAVDSPSSSRDAAVADRHVSLSSVPESFAAGTRSVRGLSHILPTALVEVRNHKGEYVPCRVLLDTASELSYITENFLKKTGISRQPSRISLSGISSIKADTTNGHCFIQMRSRVMDKTIDARVHVLNKITSNMPRFMLEGSLLDRFANVKLADPAFNRPSEVDILIGEGYVWDIFTMDKIRDQHDNIVAVSSIFGWIVTGVAYSEQQAAATSMVSLVDVDDLLRSFWEIEENFISPSADEPFHVVEEHFRTTHGRASDGKYVVELPFVNEEPAFADTLSGAMTRFRATERRLEKDLNLKKQYTNFMNEYKSLGHMRELSENEINVTDGRIFYLPHHPIVGKKLRIVFDGSFKDSTGHSLNSKLHIGSPIQRNLFAVCLRFRFHRYVFTADIVKMFRQIWVAEKHRNFQRIVWREDSKEKLQHFELCTVTYGTACAPFLAVRVLQQIAEDYRDTHPNASRILMEDFYVDDVLTGASSEITLQQYRDELVDLFSKCGLELGKWVSNSPKIKERASDNENGFLRLDSDLTKVLGIYWDSEDFIFYRVRLNSSSLATKRMVLSDVARVFDPLGLVSPVTVKFKILFQELWLQNLGWDDPLPERLAAIWHKYRCDLTNLDNLRLRRFIENRNEMQLHGFSDASTKAYAAVIFCRALDDEGNVHVSIMASKTRVAPLKQVSLPRLELCGALLLTRLMKTVVASLGQQNMEIFAWCDSTVVLSWLSIQPARLKTFVANRTSEILDSLPRNVWRHVRSKQNPADCASRGVMAEQLLDFDLWWNGPRWLREPLNCAEHDNDLDPIDNEQIDVEMKHQTTLVSCPDTSQFPLNALIERTSSWSRVLRIMAYVIRFSKNTRTHQKSKHSYLTLAELDEARIQCLSLAQECFMEEKRCLQRGEPISSKSRLLRLSPFIDDKGLLRVGGRIENSQLSEDTRHPIILPKNHNVTRMIVNEEHKTNLHPGVFSLFVIIRQQYWIIGARNLIRKVTHECLRCFRYSRQTTEQRMADLPSVRVRQAFPFENSGCDYAGPFILKLHRGRNAKTSKGYVCLFVCMVTSAIHLELVTDMSTDSFLSALRIFMARRGKCSTIFSDNGRNFIGGRRKLDEMYRQLQSEDHNIAVATALAKERIKWVFIPPYSPHWGGIWESAVRSVKLHMKRVIGNTILTFEQMRTLLAQIEAVVNSRPLGIAPDTEVDYLSPSHFLIGRPATMVPEGDLTHLAANRLDYWQHVQAMHQGFWKRWSREYLTSLQQRPKWTKITQNIELNDLVLVKEDNTPPAVWVTGRVTETFPGKDGLVRVARLRTSQGEMTRPITKLVKLPIC